MKYIQNRTNWCWVAACKVAGEQYKKNFTEFAFTLENPETEVAVSNLDGLRTDIVKRRPKITPLPNETGLTVSGGTGVAVGAKRDSASLESAIPSGAVYRISGSGAGMGTAGFAGRGK